MNRLEEHGEELAAVRQDGRLKQLLRLHLGPTPASSRHTGASAPLAPALFSSFRELGELRHDYPVVLLEGDPEHIAVPLSRLIDEIVANQSPPENGGERYRSDLYRQEAAIKALSAAGTPGNLCDLWEAAAGRCLESVGYGERRAELLAHLQAARLALSADGEVAGCDRRIGRRFFDHAWCLTRAEHDRRAREALDEFTAELSAILESDRMRSARAASADALYDAMAGPHAGIDFDALASTLRNTQKHRPLTVKRRKRVRAVLKILESEARRTAIRKGNGHSRRRRDHDDAVTRCVDLRERIDAELARLVELNRALRIAQLEVDNRYDDERHDAFFADFGIEHLSREDLQGLPPLFAYIDGDTLDPENASALVELLSSGLPVKIALEWRDLPGPAAPAPACQAGFGGWGVSLASMATMLRTAFVMQVSASHLPALAQRVAAGLDFSGPALFSLYVGPDAECTVFPRYLRCASAVESRAFPGFVHDPTLGDDWAGRFTLDGNPQPDTAWPVCEFDYEDADGRALSEDIAFTVLDFLAMDPRFSSYFVRVRQDQWHPNMTPLGEFLSLPDAEGFGKVPFLWMVDEGNHLHRVIVHRGLVAAARRCADMWHSLQELAGIGNSHALRQLAAERERQASVLEAPSAGEDAVRTEAEAAPDGPEPPAAAPETAEAQPEPGLAYIETELCTSCDDCTDRNGMLFDYNEVKQAYIKDVTAGTFRELVEAAENCPVCIIHPGKPQQSGEPQELIERANQFN